MHLKDMLFELIRAADQPKELQTADRRAARQEKAKVAAASV
jgi:hypothetical protein